jgi:hypothetical protein
MNAHMPSDAQLIFWQNEQKLHWNGIAYKKHHKGMKRSLISMRKKPFINPSIILSSIVQFEFEFFLQNV